MSKTRNIGLALSGGGSRAAAFHCGVLLAANELGLESKLKTVSTVSGGSLLGAAWMASIAKGITTTEFVPIMKGKLEKGFILKTIFRKNALNLIKPNYNRTNLLSDTFDDEFFNGLKLDQLPEEPKLCINVTVLNTGQVGRFTRDGFSSSYFGNLTENYSYPIIKVPEINLAMATTASAAFPIGLPPIKLKKDKYFPQVDFIDILENHRKIYISDGGIVENLGVQTLLKSNRYGANDIILSDAGTKENAWYRYPIFSATVSFATFCLSPNILTRLLTLMNNKQNRSMRRISVLETEISRLVDMFRKVTLKNVQNIKSQIGYNSTAGRKRIILVQINQKWSELIEKIPLWRFKKLSINPDSQCEGIEKQLLLKGIDLSREKKIYDDMGGDETVEILNSIKTGFTYLTRSEVNNLIQHASWQMHALHKIFW